MEEAVNCYAGFWIRVLACLIDFLIVMPVLICTLRTQKFGAPLMILLIEDLFIIAIWCVYSAGLESSPWQGTPGKLICGLKVTDLNGNRITFVRASGRFLIKLCFWSSPLTFLLYLSVAFNKCKQGLHDRIAGTRVLRKSCSTAPFNWSPTGDTDNLLSVRGAQEGREIRRLRDRNK